MAKTMIDWQLSDTSGPGPGPGAMPQIVSGWSVSSGPNRLAKWTRNHRLLPVSSEPAGAWYRLGGTLQHVGKLQNLNRGNFFGDNKVTNTG